MYSDFYAKYRRIEPEQATQIQESQLGFALMYRSNRSFNIPPPRATPPRAFDFFQNYCSNSPLPEPKCPSNAPHWGPFWWSNAPTSGTKLSCIAAEIAATRSLNAQLFFVLHATYKAFYKKIPATKITTFHTCDIHDHSTVIDLGNWAFYCWIESPVYSRSGYRNCKYNLIQSYIQSLNPILKILKCKYLQI